MVCSVPAAVAAPAPASRPHWLPRLCRRRPELRFRSAARGRGVSAATRASHAAVRADLSAEAEPSRARPLLSLQGQQRRRPRPKGALGVHRTRAVGGAGDEVLGRVLGVTVLQVEQMHLYAWASPVGWGEI